MTAMEKTLAAIDAHREWWAANGDKVERAGTVARRRVLEGQDVGLINIAYERVCSYGGDRRIVIAGVSW